jgi:hypothetical protein
MERYGNFLKKVVCESARGRSCWISLSIFVKYPHLLPEKGCKTKDINTIHIVCIIWCNIWLYPGHLIQIIGSWWYFMKYYKILNNVIGVNIAQSQSP